MTSLRLAANLYRKAPLFAALGDRTRLELLIQLGEVESMSISHLADQRAMTRQAITKHLRVMEKAGLVRAKKCGREQLYCLRPEAIKEVQQTLNAISNQWDAALDRLKQFVERDSV